MMQASVAGVQNRESLIRTGGSPGRLLEGGGSGLAKERSGHAEVNDLSRLLFAQSL